MEGRAAPAFSLPSLDGDTVNLADHLGKDVIVLDFWASWCPPCRQAMPAVAAVATQYRDKAVAVFGVNLGESAATARAFLSSAGLEHLPVLLDETGTVGEQYGARSIPRLVVIDKDGNIRHVHVGYSSNLQSTLGKSIDALLARQS